MVCSPFYKIKKLLPEGALISESDGQWTKPISPTFFFHFQTHKYLIISTAPSSVPQSVTVEAVDSTSARVSWQPPPFEDRNGIISGYLVRVLGLNTPDNDVLPLVNATMLLVEGLHPFYAYRFSVAAETVATGPFSTAVTQKLPEGSKSADPK